MLASLSNASKGASLHQLEPVAHLVRVQKADIFPKLAVAAVFTVGHKVDEAVSLLLYRKGLALHLVHPTSGQESHHLSKPPQAVTSLASVVCQRNDSAHTADDPGLTAWRAA